MTYLTLDDSIGKVGFSTRCHTCLRRAGIKTISDLMEYGRDKFPKIRSFGTKGVNEAIQFLDSLKAGTGDFRLVSSDGLPISVVEKANGLPVHMTFRNSNGILYHDIPLENIGLPIRAYNNLKYAGYNYASELIDTSENQLLTDRNLMNLSNNSIRKILQIIRSLTFDEVQTTAETEDLNCNAFIRAVAGLLPIHITRLYQELVPVFERANESGDPVTNEELYDVPCLREAVKDKISHFLSGQAFGVTIDEISLLFPGILENYVLLNIIAEMKSEGLINVGNKIEYKRVTILEYARSVLSEKGYDIFTKRLQGHSLSSIGAEHNITKERVRQITKKFLYNKHLKGIQVVEDKYIEILTKYYITKDDFIYGFDEDELVWNYLSLFLPIITDKTSKEPKLRLDQLIRDKSFPMVVRRGAEKAVYGNYIAKR